MTFNGVYHFPSYKMWCDFVDKNEFSYYSNKTSNEYAEIAKKFWHEYKTEFCAELYMNKNGKYTISYCDKEWFIKHEYDVKEAILNPLLVELI